MLLEQRVMREARGEKGQKGSDRHPADFECSVHRWRPHGFNCTGGTAIRCLIHLRRAARRP